MRIAPPDDNVKIQRENRPSNIRGAETRPVNELTKTSNLPPIESRHEHDAHIREEEHRHYQRRQQKKDTTLDTREPHERRTQPRDTGETETSVQDEEDVTPQGIDVLA